MTINGLEVPIELEADLISGGRRLDDSALARFRELLGHVEKPLPMLFDYDGIVSANRLWTSEYVGHYLGMINDRYHPGDIDPKRTLIFGRSDPDSPIALDYRTSGPRVVYFGDADDESYWFELSPDYRSLFSMLLMPL
jgi:hypothetical protein